MALDRNALLAAVTLKMEEVDLPGLGSVYVRELTGTERDRLEELQSKLGYKMFRARFAVATVCDHTGALLFTEADFDAVGKLPATVLDRVFEVAKRLNGIGAEEAEKLEKN